MVLKRASYEGPPPADYSAPTSTWLSFAISPAQPRPAKSSLCSSSPPVLLLPNTHSFLFLSFKPRRRYRSLPSLPFQHAHEEASLPACLCLATLIDWPAVHQQRTRDQRPDCDHEPRPTTKITTETTTKTTTKSNSRFSRPRSGYRLSTDRARWSRLCRIRAATPYQVGVCRFPAFVSPSYLHKLYLHCLGLFAAVGAHISSCSSTNGSLMNRS